ncbi:MAG: lipid-A-disaccharide synthase N-terminal domain-containing protein [Phycisphaerales bacterium]|nr:lipid-A-disaccharide synthase N-terminal domain-containing protein [Phycisphaerales bacterium]
MSEEPRKRVKWEPVVAMVGLLLLGFWVAFAPDVPQPRPANAERARLSIGPVKGVLEWVPESAPSGSSAARKPAVFAVHYRDGTTVSNLSAADIDRLLGPGAVERITSGRSNWLYRAVNVSTPLGVAWVVLGFAGQIIFGGRWIVQWIASEKARASEVPISFWWMSLLGSAMLFAYFVWRNDVVGVLGQTSGVVIYARNIQLIRKRARREARAAAPAPSPL